MMSASTLRCCGSNAALFRADNDSIRSKTPLWFKPFCFNRLSSSACNQEGKRILPRTRCQSATSAERGAQAERNAGQSPGGSAGEDGMSADLRHMKEAGPIGDSAAGVAGKVRSAEELEAADETAEEMGSPAKSALSSDYGPGASAINPGVDSAGEIDYSKATVQPGGLPTGSSIGASPPRGETLQESDSAPGAQGYGGQQGGSADGAVLAESFEAQEAREPEILSKQVRKASGSGGDGAASSEKRAAGAKKTSEGKTSLVPDEDLVGSKRSKVPQEESKPGKSGDLNDAVGPTHQSL